MAVSIKIADSQGEIRRCFPVMKQLRDVTSPEDFEQRVSVQAREGYQLAFVESDGEVVALAGFRFYHMLATGKTLYVDDLVTDEARRSERFGEALMQWLIELARKSDCRMFSLDSGVRRGRAHRFYFMQGMHIANYHFELPLS
jgi:GNAT superfamily N-acetyltransferase